MSLLGVPVARFSLIASSDRQPRQHRLLEPEVTSCASARWHGMSGWIENPTPDNSLFGDGTRSWVMIVNGINKYVTEMSEETQENHIDDIGDSTGKPIARARPNQTSMPMCSSPTVTLPYHLREWIDVEPGKCDESCFEVSKKMIILLQHDPTVLREEAGAVEFRTLAPMFRSIRTWLNYLQGEGGAKKRYQCFVDPYAAVSIFFLRAIQSQS